MAGELSGVGLQVRPWWMLGAAVCPPRRDGWTWQGVQGICQRVSHPLVLWLWGRGIVEYPELGPPGPAEPPQQSPPCPGAVPAGSCSWRPSTGAAWEWGAGTGGSPCLSPSPGAAPCRGHSCCHQVPGKQDLLFVVIIIIIILMFSWQSSPSLHGGYCVSPRSQKCSPTSARARPCRHLMMKLLLLLFAGIFRVGVDLCFYPC